MISNSPCTGERQLNAVPLVGTGTGGRPEKFLLGKLAVHRGKSVDAIINESVSGYLARSNYNDTTEIANLLRDLGLDPKGAATHFPAIGKLLNRRHEIVHRADFSDEDSDSPDFLRNISRQDVEAWLEAVKGLTQYMMAHIIRNEMASRGYK